MAKIQSIRRFISLIRWDSKGLVPCVVQDSKTREVLMVAYMNRKSLEKTIQGGRACFWSRSRKKLWTKGEESGNFQAVKSVYLDCDQDCVLIQVKQAGGSACHTGMRSCFYRKLDSKGRLIVNQKRVFDPKKVYGRSR